MFTFTTGLVAGAVLLTVFPVPWLQAWILDGWRWVGAKIKGSLA